MNLQKNNSLSIINTLPNEYLNNMKELLSKSDFELLIKSYDESSHQGIIINKNKINTNLIDKFTADFDLINIDKYTYEIRNKEYLLKNEKIGKNVFHHIGSFYVSEPSALRVIPKLDIKEDDIVLDLCAAPGGKSIQALMYLDEKKGGMLYANEIISSRCKILSSNLERVGFSNVVILNSDAKTLSGKFNNYFDKIIIDAPCSGEGMFRKYPYAIDEWSLSNVNMCAKRQKEIVSDAISMLKDGGMFSYSTCTFEVKEDEEIRDYILQNKNLSLVYEEKIFPFMNKGEGQYIAVFKKNGSACSDRSVNKFVFKNRISSILSKYKNIYFDFEKTYLRKSLLSENKYLLLINDNLYLSNKIALELDDDILYKNGILLGSINKNVFIPSHALSHYIESENFLNIIDFSNDINNVDKYLKGLEITVNKNEFTNNNTLINGYVLVCYNNLCIGLGKLSIKEDKLIIKNHYPKGLRNL